MRKITLDFTGIYNRDNLHQYLKEQFEFPEYYGENLDALHDELTSIMEDTEVVFAEGCTIAQDSAADCNGADETGMTQIARSEKMERYLQKMRKVFEDAAEENRHLRL